MFEDILQVGIKLIDKLIPDQKARDDAKIKLLELQNAGELKQFEFEIELAKAQSEVIKSEASSESWLARNWRPIIMVCFTVIIVNNYILVPWLNIFGFKTAILDIPEKMWSLIELGMTGYIVSRGCEKIVEKWKK